LKIQNSTASHPKIQTGKKEKLNFYHPMKTTRFTTSQIVQALKEYERGKKAHINLPSGNYH
jgi:hypothetical protein